MNSVFGVLNAGSVTWSQCWLTHPHRGCSKDLRSQSGMVWGKLPQIWRKEGGREGKGKKRALPGTHCFLHIFVTKLSGSGKSRCTTSARWHKWRANIWWFKSELLSFTFNKVWLKDPRAAVSLCQVLHKHGKSGWRGSKKEFSQGINTVYFCN